MSQIAHVGPLPSYTYVGMAGLSLASVFGIIKLWKHAESEKKDAEISSLRRSLSATRIDVQAKDEALALLSNELGDLRKQLEEMGNQLENARNHNQALENQVKGQAREARLLRDEAQRMNTKHAQTLELLEARTFELKGAQTFLTKADALSGADVMTMLQMLNSEIYQTAALVAESFEFRDKRGPNMEQGEEKGEETEDMNEIYASAVEILGPRMVDLLKSSVHHEDPMLIQIAFQAGMSAYSNWIISSWYFEDPEDEHLLSEIYARVRRSEDQAVSGRWRALTRAHAQRLADHEPDLAMYFVDAFVNILITAGVSESQPALHAAIVTRFAERIAIIVKGAQRLNKAIGEDVTSCDFGVLYVHHNIAFDPSTMDDAFESGPGKEEDISEPVLCTTDLGLARIVREPGREVRWDETVLLRPKIVLQSGLEAVIAD